MHWGKYARLKDKWMWLIKAELGASRPRFEQCYVRIIRYSTAVDMDWDNLYGTAKIPMDVLRDLGVIPDDNPRCVIRLDLDHVHADRVADTGVEIQVMHPDEVIEVTTFVCRSFPEEDK